MTSPPSASILGRTVFKATTKGQVRSKAEMKTCKRFLLYFFLVFLILFLPRERVHSADRSQSEREWKEIQRDFEKDFDREKTSVSLNAIKRVVDSGFFEGIQLLAGRLLPSGGILHQRENELKNWEVERDELEKLLQKSPKSRGAKERLERVSERIEEKKAAFSGEKEIREALISGIVSLMGTRGNKNWGKGMGELKEYTGEKHPWRIRNTFFEVLGRLGGPEVLSFLEEELRRSIIRIHNLKEEKEEKRRALERAEKIFDQAVKTGRGKVSKPVYEEYKNKKEILREVVDRMVGEVRLQQALVEVLGQTASQMEGEWIQELVQTASRIAQNAKVFSIRQVYLELLGLIRSPYSKSVLKDLLKKEESTSLRVTIIQALARLKDESAVDLFLEMLQSEEWQVRAAAIHALGEVPLRKSVLPLIEALERETGRLKGDIEEVLFTLTGETFHSNVILWKEWWEKNGETFKLVPKGVKGDADPKNNSSKSEISFYGIQTFSQKIVFVIDVSGSMAEPSESTIKGRTKMDVAKEELIRAIKGLKEDGSFNIIYYEANVEIYQKRMVKASKENKEKAFHFIRNELNPEGATNIYDALKETFDVIGREYYGKHYAPPVDTIFFLSDGEPTHGEILDTGKIAEEITQRNRNLQVVIHTVGVGPKHNVTFMRELAEKNGGTYVSR